MAFTDNLPSFLVKNHVCFILKPIGIHFLTPRETVEVDQMLCWQFHDMHLRCCFSDGWTMLHNLSSSYGRFFVLWGLNSQEKIHLYMLPSSFKRDGSSLFHAA